MNSYTASTGSLGMASGPGPTNPAPRRILLVDDDPINQMVALGLLRRHGWDAIAAANGKEALQILTRQSVDLILLDLQMPEMDGYETAVIIRQNEAQSAPPPTPRESLGDRVRERTTLPGSRIPIIALTTASQPGVREKCLASGMDDFLTKPVNPRELYATVEKHLSGHT